METKICTKCGRELPVMTFVKNKSENDGLSSWCKECYKQYREEHKEEIKEYNKLYHKEYYKQYIKTPMGRACNLISAYNQSDKQHDRGKGDLTAKWIVENIFTKTCKCGRSGWEIMGCNRLDNSKPHTKDNVEPCCTECNRKLPRK